MRTLALQAEEALDAAKASGHDDPAQRKNAVVVFRERVRWTDWPQIEAAQDALDDVCEKHRLSTSYVYGLFRLIDLAADVDNPEHAMWRSRFAYRTRRYVVDKIRKQAKRPGAQTELATVLGSQGIEQLGTRFRIPLYNHFYRDR